MKSLHLTNSWHAHSGGIATFYRALLDEAERQGRQMAMVIPGEHDGCERRTHTRIYTVRGAPSPFNSSYRVILPNAWPGINRRVAEIVREEQPDLIEVCDKYSLHYLAGFIRRGLFSLPHRPVLIGLSCERMRDSVKAYVASGRLTDRLSRFYMKWLYFAFFDHHLTVSTHTADELRDAGRGHVRQRGVWIRPMGVDLANFSPHLRDSAFRQQLARRAQGNPDSRLVLYAGRLVPEKNLPLLLDTFEQLLPDHDADYRLIVAGDGILRPSLIEQAEKRFPGYSLWLGHLEDREALARLYANADIFLHTNPHEPFGISPLEAMASGVPVVLPNSGGVLSYADPSNAILAEPNAAAMAAGVRRVFTTDPTERVAQARATALRYDWPVIARDFLHLYAGFLRGESFAQPDFLSTPGSWLGLETGN